MKITYYNGTISDRFKALAVKFSEPSRHLNGKRVFPAITKWNGGAPTGQLFWFSVYHNLVWMLMKFNLLFTLPLDTDEKPTTTGTKL